MPSDVSVLKPLLGPELYKLVTAKIAEAESEVSLVDLKQGKYVALNKYNEVVADQDTLKETVSSYDQQLAALKALKPEEMQATIQQMQQEQAAAKQKYEQQLATIQLDSLITAGLANAKARDVKLVSAAIDRNALKVTGDTLVGLEPQVEALKKSHAYLFEGAEDTGNSKKSPDSLGGGFSGTRPVGKQDTDPVAGTSTFMNDFIRNLGKVD